MKILLSSDQLREGVERLAGEISTYYLGQPLTVVGVLTGSVVLLADLIRQFELPLRVGLVQASSYRDSTMPGELAINTDLLPDIRDRHVLLVDDIFDTGHTLDRLTHKLRALGPASLRSAVLLRKHGRKATAIEPDHVAFEIPNEFVVGYGLDYRDMYRNLPYVAAIEPGEL